MDRLQKILAAAGVASRRAAEELITSGRVRVDGKVVTELGFKADPSRQKIELDGKLLAQEEHVYVIFHKPRGVVCTLSDPEDRPTVADYLEGVQGRVVPVGRLDFHTSGVLLFTNDGEFAATLSHPKAECEKVYVAKVQGALDQETLERWQEPIEIDGKKTKPAAVRKLRFELGKTWLEVTLKEGKNRQIHRIGEAVGTRVLRLARVQFAGLNAEGLRPGQWRYLAKDELVKLKKEHGVPSRIHAAPPLPNQKEIRKARATGKSKGRAVVTGKPGVRSSNPARTGQLGRGEKAREDAVQKPSDALRASRTASAARETKGTSKARGARVASAPKKTGKPARVSKRSTSAK